MGAVLFSRRAVCRDKLFASAGRASRGSCWRGRAGVDFRRDRSPFLATASCFRATWKTVGWSRGGGKPFSVGIGVLVGDPGCLEPALHLEPLPLRKQSQSTERERTTSSFSQPEALRLCIPPLHDHHLLSSPLCDLLLGDRSSFPSTSGLCPHWPHCQDLLSLFPQHDRSREPPV